MKPHKNQLGVGTVEQDIFGVMGLLLRIAPGFLLTFLGEHDACPQSAGTREQPA